MDYATLKLWREGGQVFAQWEGDSDHCQIEGRILEWLHVPKYWGQVFAIGSVDLQIVGYNMHTDTYECKHLPIEDEDTVNLLRN